MLRNGSGPGSTFSLPSQTNAILVSSSQFRPEDASVASVGKLRANDTKPEGNNDKLLLGVVFPTFAVDIGSSRTGVPGSGWVCATARNYADQGRIRTTTGRWG